MALSMTVLPASAEETATKVTIKGTQFSNTLADQNGIAYNQYQDTRPMSVIFNVAEEGYYNFQFRASDGTQAYLSAYDVELNGGSEFEKKESGELESNAIYKVFDYGTVYLDAGLNQLTYTITEKRALGDYLMYLDYAKFTKTTYEDPNTINLTYSDEAFSGGGVNSGANFRFINGNEPGTATVTVSANTAGWYKMSYEATAGNGSNSWLSEYSITLNDNDVTVPAPGTSTDNSMNKHEVAESVWLNEGNNTLVFNINKPRPGDGNYYFTIRSVSFALSDKANNKINLPYSSFSGMQATGVLDDYTIAYNSDATPRTMTATFNVKETGVYSLRLLSTTGAPGADGKKDWHSAFEVKVNGVSINNFTKTANVLKPNGTAAEHLVGNVAKNITLTEGANTIEITPTALSANNVYLLYLKDALFTKTASIEPKIIDAFWLAGMGVGVTYTNTKPAGKLIAVVHNDSGELTEVKVIDAETTLEPVEKMIPITSTEGNIKVMLWEDLGKANPLAPAYPVE